MSKPPSWWLRGGELQPTLDDPRSAISALLAALPVEVRTTFIAFSRFGLSGAVTVCFKDGAAVGVEQKTSHSTRE